MKTFSTEIKKYSNLTEDYKMRIKESQEKLELSSKIVKLISNNQDEFVEILNSITLNKITNVDNLLDKFRKDESGLKKTIASFKGTISKDKVRDKFREEIKSEIVGKFKLDPKLVQVPIFTSSTSKGDYFDLPEKSEDYINIESINNNDNPFELITGNVSDLVSRARRIDEPVDRELKDGLVIRCNKFGKLTLFIPMKALR